MRRDLIRILFNVFADTHQINAQSLNAREIALRLDSRRFRSTLFFAREPDPRLANRPGVTTKKVPPRGGSLFIAREMILGRYDFIFYFYPGRASSIYGYLGDWHAKTVLITPVEGSAQQILATPVRDREGLLGILRRSRHRFAITSHIAATMSTVFGINGFEVIPVGVDPTYFLPVDRSSHGLPLKVLFVGSMQPRKEAAVVLDLADSFRQEPIEFHLVGGPIGDRKYLDGLLAEKKRRQLEHVVFHGVLSQEGIRDWMGRCDVLILPSRLEGLPKVTLEAAATAMPSVVFRDYQTPSVVDGITGFQVDTVRAASERLSSLLEDPVLRLRLGNGAREHALQFDWNLVAKQWETAFERMHKSQGEQLL